MQSASVKIIAHDSMNSINSCSWKTLYKIVFLSVHLNVILSAYTHTLDLQFLKVTFILSKDFFYWKIFILIFRKLNIAQIIFHKAILFCLFASLEKIQNFLTK